MKSSASARKENRDSNMVSQSQNQLNVAMAFQDKEKAMNGEAQSMQQRIDDLERERDISGHTYDKSQRAAQTMSQYED